VIVAQDAWTMTGYRLTSCCQRTAHQREGDWMNKGLRARALPRPDMAGPSS
jgi:hypothetical protein